MRKLSIVVVMLSIGVLSGCTKFQVKNTDGLGLAYADIDLASSKGSQLRAMSNVNEPQRQQAADLYREAKAVINSYLQQSITDASGYTVDKNAQSYATTKGSEKLAAFQKKVGELQGTTTASVGEWIPLAALAIAEIRKLHDQDQKAGYERFVATVNKYMMKNYEELPGGKLEK